MCLYDEAVFIQLSTSIIIIGYINDFLIFYKKKNDLKLLEESLIKSVRLDKIGTPKTFLRHNLTIISNTREIWIDQKDYTQKSLK